MAENKVFTEIIKFIFKPEQLFMKLKMVIVLLVTSGLFAAKINVTDQASIEKYGKLVAGNLLERKCAYSGAGGMDYPEACAAIGALRFANNSNNKHLIDELVLRYAGFLAKGNKFVNDIEHVDHNVRGIVPFQVFLITGDENFKTVGLDHADRQWVKEIDGGLTFQTRWWIDDMYMVGSLQMQAYRATGNPEYADKAARFLHAYIDRLQQPNGLFFHGPKFKYHWGRGNGWVAASMAEVLKDLPKDNPHRPAIIASYKKMMASLLKYQSDNGLWRQLIDVKYSWTESSCSAMFAYAMSVGVKLDILDSAEYEPAVVEAWNGLCWQLNRDGRIRDVCVGTNQKDDIEFYLNRPRNTGDLHGQAPFLWLAAELLDD